MTTSCNHQCAIAGAELQLLRFLRPPYRSRLIRRNSATYLGSEELIYEDCINR